MDMDNNIFLKVLEMAVEGQMNVPTTVVVVSGVFIKHVLGHYISVRTVNHESEKINNNHEQRMYELETERQKIMRENDHKNIDTD